MPISSKRLGQVAAGCTAVLVLLSVALCGLSALLRQYRELTVPLAVLLGMGAAAMGVLAYFMARQRR